MTTSGAIPPGGRELGEVMVDGEAYLALSSDPEHGIAPHTQVLIIELHPPRTVVVTPF